jgi:two-component system, cell cycle sensor histidine kinase and response regulator CckA
MVEPARLLPEHVRPDSVVALDTLQEAYIRLDGDFRLTYANPSALALFELPLAYVAGRTPWEVRPESAGSQLERGMRRAKAEGAVVCFENHYPPWNRWYGITAMPDASGGLIVHFSDITDRKDADERLRARSERFRRLVERSDVGYYRVGADGLYQDVNPAYLRLHGFARKEEVIGRHFTFTAPSDERPRAEGLFQRLMRGEAIGSGELASRHSNGTVRYLTYTADPIYENGAVAGVEGFVIETTQRRLDEEQRRLTEARYAAVLSSMAEGVIFLDAGGRIIFSNRRAEEILGLTADQMAGRTSVDPRWAAIHEDGSPFPGETHPAMVTLRTGQPLSNVVMGVHKPDGTLNWISINSRLVQGDPSGVVTTFNDITECKTHQAALLEAQKNYQEIFDHALEGIYQVSPEGRLLKANPAFARILGFSSAEEAVATVTDSARQIWLDPRDRLRFIATAEAGKGFANFEARLKRKDGTPIWVSISGRRVPGPDGKTLYYEALITDITERKRAQEQLADNLRIAEIAQRVARFGLFRWDAKTGRTYWSPEIFRLYGLDPATTQPSSESCLRELVHQDDRDRVVREFQESMSNPGEPLQTEFRTRDGLRWMTAIGQLYRDGQGQPDHMVGIHIDLTRRKLSEQALRDSEERYRGLFEMGADAVVVVARDSGMFLDVNQAALRIYGYTREEFLTLSFTDVSAEPERTRESVLAQETWIPFRWHRGKNGEVFPVEIRAADFSWRGRPVVLAAIRDISERRSMEAERAHLEEALIQAQKLESVGRLAGGVAHDFNNLLTVVNGYAAMLTRQLRPDDPAWDLASEIGKAGRRAGNLTRQLLAFSRKQMFRVRQVELNGLIRQYEPEFQRLLGNRIEMSMRLEESLAPIMADPEQVHEVLMDLILNARDAMPGGGRLDIQTKDVEINESGAGCRYDVAPGSYVLLAITDTGRGMDDATVEHIFEPFFTTKEFGSGSGLGLSTVYGIVRQTGGWIDVWTYPGEGSSFRIYLPRAVVAQASAADGPADSGATVLVVEGEHPVRKFIKAALESRGYEVIEAAGPETARQAAAAHPGPIDLLLTDVVSPEMTGERLSEMLREQRPGLLVLFLSDYAARTTDLARFPGAAFVQKPIGVDELLAAVQQLLGRRPAV